MPETKRRFSPIASIYIAAINAAAAVFAIPFILNVNQFRPQLETWLTGARGRDVQCGKA
jgi:hypothetical protein